MIFCCLLLLVVRQEGARISLDLLAWGSSLDWGESFVPILGGKDHNGCYESNNTIRKPPLHLVFKK
jgi:hypothetical protein